MPGDDLILAFSRKPRSASAFEQRDEVVEVGEIEEAVGVDVGDWVARLESQDERIKVAEIDEQAFVSAIPVSSVWGKGVGFDSLSID